jgi:predicted hotdog family 3-hydroxylacyl-ACP dehydratase
MPLNPALDREWIEAHIPHQGRMCLLDEVLSWDVNHIRCRTASHRLADHPMRRHGHLGIACGIEYVAQAMAVHGAIGAIEASGAAQSAGEAKKVAVGFLAGLRDVRMHASRLDDIDSDLVCEVRRVAGDASTAIYFFSLDAAQRPLLDGRATVVLDAGERMSP